MDNWGSNNQNQLNQCNTGGNANAGWDANNQPNRQGILVNEKGLQNAVQKKAYLFQNLMTYMKFVKAGIKTRSEQTTSEHQHTIERMKYELAEYEKRAVLEMNYWSTQKQRVETGMSDVVQAIQRLSQSLQTISSQHAPVLLRDLLMPDYSWLDSIVEKLNPPTAVTEDWSRLKQNMLKWNVLMNEISSRALFRSSLPEQNPFSSTPVSHSAPSNNSLQFAQTPQSTQLCNLLGTGPTASFVSPANSFPLSTPHGMLRHENPGSMPSTSASCSQPYPSQNTIPNYNPPNGTNAPEMQNQLLRDLLNQPNTVMQVSQTHVILNSAQSMSGYNQQKQYQEGAHEEQAQLRLQHQKLLHLKQMELQMQRQLQLQQSSLLVSSPSSFASSNAYHHEPVNDCATMQTQQVESFPTARTEITEDESTIGRISSADDQNSDDGCEVIEEVDPLADISPPNQNRSEMFPPLINQLEIQTLAKAQRMNTQCCSGIFEEETTEVIHLENESPTLIIENSITPPYSDLSDQEQPQGSHRCMPSGHRNNAHAFASTDMKNSPESVINRLQSIIMKRNSTGCISDGDACVKNAKLARRDSSDASTRLNPAIANETSKASALRAASNGSVVQKRPSTGSSTVEAAPARPQNHPIRCELPTNIITFEDLNLDDRLVCGLKELGFRQLTLAQKLGFPAFLKRKELLLVAEKCLGKTTMALVGLLHLLNLEAASSSRTTTSLQAIIITSSMTSGVSIKEQFNKLAAFTPRPNSGTTFKAVCTADSVFGNGHVLIGDPPAMKTFFTLEQQQADQFNKTRNIKYIIIDNTENMKPEFFPMMIGIIYSSHIRGDTQVAVLTRTLEVPGFTYLRKALKNPQLISVPAQTKYGKPATPPVNSCDRDRGILFPSMFLTSDSKEHEPGSCRRSASPPVMSIPENCSETTAEATQFFVAEMAITTSETSDHQETDSISKFLESEATTETADVNPVTCEPEISDSPNVESADVVEDDQNDAVTGPEVSPIGSHSAVALSTLSTPDCPDPLPIAPPTQSSISVTEPAMTIPTTPAITATAPAMTIETAVRTTVLTTALCPQGSASLRHNTNTAPPPLSSSVQIQLPGNFNHFQHFYCEANDLSDKLETVNALARTIMVGQALIFCSKTECSWLMSELSDNENLLCRALDDDQSELLTLLKAFDHGELKALILPDDIAVKYEGRLRKVPFILNFDCPENDSVYLKRSSFATVKQTDSPEEGRNVIILSFVGDDNELHILREIEKKHNISITDASSPDDDS